MADSGDLRLPKSARDTAKTAAAEAIRGRNVLATLRLAKIGEFEEDSAAYARAVAASILIRSVRWTPERIDVLRGVIDAFRKADIRDVDR